MKQPKTVKSLVSTLKILVEDMSIRELKGANNLSEEEIEYLIATIGNIQNDLGDMSYEVWEKTKIKPYKG